VTDAQPLRQPAKLVTVDELAALADPAWKSRGEWVMTNGCFDLLHVGHVRCLQDARRYGAHLVVALNTDRSVRAIKGEGRPRTPELERVEVIAALGCVDYVVLFDSNDVAPLLARVKPPIVAKGTDYTPENYPERETVKAYGGRVVICGDPKDHSSTQIISTL
jgi:rfaE bifunctional protein nucleotidyltransferase chain/domain